jgi:hypothetical protein
VSILGIIASSRLVAPPVGDFESIATVTVGGGGAANVEFTSIPATYTHLQVRVFGQTNRATYGVDPMRVQFNGVSGASGGSGYTRHGIQGDGSDDIAFGADSSSNNNDGQFAWSLGTTTGSSWGTGIIDILDYANTNKYKTIRSIGGVDLNGTVGGSGGFVGLGSNLFLYTTAITSIKLIPFVGSTISEYSHFALYGIKGA